MTNRVIGFACFCLGALVVIHDLGTFAYGEPDATVLFALLAFGQTNGHAEWQAFLMWVAPMIVGAAMLLRPSRAPSR